MGIAWIAACNIGRVVFIVFAIFKEVTTPVFSKVKYFCILLKVSDVVFNVVIILFNGGNILFITGDQKSLIISYWKTIKKWKN